MRSVPATDDFGGAITSAGQIVLISTQRGQLQISSGGVVTPEQAAMQAARWPIARGDDFVYFATSTLYGTAPLGAPPAMASIDWGDGGVGPQLNGLVNALNGDLVGIPGGDPIVRIFTPTPTSPAPGRPALLLSPFLNKL